MVHPIALASGMARLDPLRTWSVHRNFRSKPDGADGQRQLSIVVLELRVTRLKLLSEVLNFIRRRPGIRATLHDSGIWEGDVPNSPMLCAANAGAVGMNFDTR